MISSVHGTRFDETAAEFAIVKAELAVEWLSSGKGLGVLLLVLQSFWPHPLPCDSKSFANCSTSLPSFTWAKAPVCIAEFTWKEFVDGLIYKHLGDLARRC